jgi:hypothetical protein
MKTITKGSGITAYMVEQTETAEELKAALRALSKRPSDGFALDDDVESWARRTLDGATPQAIAAEHSREWYAESILRWLNYTRAEIARGDAAQAAARALRLGDLLAEARIKFRWEKAALTGQKFIAGRKSGTGGPIRKAIARLLKKNQAMKNLELWETLSDNPPRGWQFNDNHVGKYIEGPKGGDSMNYARFCNIASEEKRKLRG